MRWKSLAFLVIILSAASAQVVSIDNDLHLLETISHSTAPDSADPANNEGASSTTEALEQHRDIPTYNNEDNREDNSRSTNEDQGNSSENANTNDNESKGSDEGSAQEYNSQETRIGENTEINGTTESTPPTTTEGTTSATGGTTTNSAETSEEPENGGEAVASRSTEETDDEDIDVEGGLVRGHSLHGNLGIRSFIDIPYGRFRGLFQAPTKPEPWDTIHDVREHAKRCPQIDESGNYAGDTDCLTLSVFAPSNVENAAVLFHIYDGDFKTGSADPLIYGPEHLVTKGLILVIPNYRIGVLGFLCLNNLVAPGNAGLKDLALALEWTKNNIAQFGGNSSKIFVSGDGVSGALAGYLALSPISRPYVSGVITESGSVLAPWAIDRDPRSTAALLADALNENIDNEVNAEIMVKAGKDIDFRPCVETGTDPFISDTPWQILHNTEDNIAIPFIIGSANHAGLQEAMFHTSESLSELNSNFSRLLPNDLNFENDEKVAIAEKIKKQYFGENDIGLDHIDQLSLCYTDALYLGPSIRAARALIEAGAKVYFYEFSFVGELNRMQQSLSTTVQGAARGDLTSYIFTQDGEMPEEGSVEEIKVDIITDLWVSFLQDGVPYADSVSWDYMENVAATEEKWLLIDKEVNLRDGVHEDRMALWTEIYHDYFIERNLAMEIRSSLFLIVIGILLLEFRK